MSEQNQADNQLDQSTDYESALDTEQTKAKSNITITESAQTYLADLLSNKIPMVSVCVSSLSILARRALNAAWRIISRAKKTART